MSIIASHSGLLVAMWIVLVAVGLQVAMHLVTNLRSKANFSHMANAVLAPMVSDILPLILLSWLITIDGTHILIRIWYYVGAALIVLRALVSLSRSLRR